VHTHDGGPAGTREHHKERLRMALGLALGCLVLEVVGGLMSGSLALLADAAHLLADVAGLVLAYAAMSLADFVPTKKYTFGLYRAEILAAFVNAEVLLVVTGFLFYEAYQRAFAPPEVHTGLMSGVAALGLLINLGAVWLLRGGREQSLNLKAAYLEVVSDALGALGALVAAGVMSVTGWFWVDPLVSAAIGCVVLPRSITLLRQSVHVLLEGTPAELDLTEIRQELMRLPSIVELHDLHFWTLTSGLHAASVHVRAADESVSGEVLRSVRKLLKDTAGIDHSTIQVECGPGERCETTDHA
jgi:cobalt-zinc-cadmium efflux system protein